MAEILKWGNERLLISGSEGSRRILATSRNGSMALPGIAEVIARPVQDCGGTPGTSFYFKQTPEVSVVGFEGPPQAERQFSRNTDDLLGRKAIIHPDGSFYPPQLPEILDQITQDWGWKIDPEVSNLLNSVVRT